MVWSEGELMARSKGLTAAQIQELVGGLEVTVEPIGRLQEYAGNAKEHTAEQVGQIKDSMRQVGFCDPIGVWTNAEGKSEVVEGHGRLMAALELGLESVPVIHLDGLTDEQRRFYALVHNKLTMSTGWDFSKLDAELASLDGWDMAEFGFDIELPEFDMGGEDEASGEDEPDAARATLSDRFGFVPFSVIRSTDGNWMERKRLWHALGIRSELGRGAADQKTVRNHERSIR